MLTFAALATTFSSGITHLLAANAHNTNSVPVTVGFLVLTGGLWWLSRRGFYKIGAHALTALLFLAGMQLAIAWSVDLPMAQLINVLVIIVAGLVISLRAVVVVTVLVSISTALLGYAQYYRYIPVDTSWLTKRVELSDSIGIIVVYAVVGVVAWLANNEIDSLLRRAWRSEKALARERDQLEVTVATRTRELEEIQLAKTLELQRFAEFGRVSASLVHDLSNPLTAASLNLEQAGNQAGTSLVGEALASLRHIESYISSARKQLQGTSRPTAFSASMAATEVVRLLKNQSQAAGVELILKTTNNDIVYGDVVALHRVLANLIINAIQACSNNKSIEQGKVTISLKVEGEYLVIKVQDNGVGIKASDLPYIFDEFYSSNRKTARGIGLGLANAKRKIEQGFKGYIGATSTSKKSTLFTIGIPLHESNNKTQHRRRSKVFSK